jgi:hypothetical protein
LDQALRQALGTSQPALRRQALDRAAAHLVHPRLILDSPLLDDKHPWRLEALAVSDAFEAVTNGMEEPGVFAALDDLEPESPFQPWRHLILGLHFFYEGLDEAVAAHLERIPVASPLAPLARMVARLCQGQRPSGPPALARLAELVLEPDPRLLAWVQDVAEGLETDNEDLFWEAFNDWLEAVAPSAPGRARSAVLWAWNQLEWRDFDEAVLLDLGSSLWGRAEAYRLAALGTLAWDPEGSALLWLRFLVSACREGADQSTLAEALTWLERFRQAAVEQGTASPEWSDTWRNLTCAWNDEVAVRGWPAFALEAPASPAAPARPASDGQLDLFAP